MMRSDTVIILQARMASKRLPGKAMRRIGDRTLLRRCLDRLAASGVAPVLLATTLRPEDDVLVNEAGQAGVPAFRGADENVLRRFVSAAQSVDASVVVRATADNPLVDIDAPGRVLAALTAADADHAIDVGLPIGCAVEAVTVRALRKAVESTGSPFDLEHVTPFIRRELTLFRAIESPAPAAVRRPDLRLTVDTPQDLHYVREVLEHLGDSDRDWPLERIIESADRVGTAAVVS